MGSKLSGRGAVITGAGSGIGLAAAHLFVAEGSAVAVLDRDPIRVKEAVEQLQAAGGRAMGAAVDISSPDQVQAGVADVVAEFGKIDVLFNNAGADAFGSVVTSSLEDWDRCFSVNARGTFLVSQAVIPHMTDDGCAIVNTASICGLVGVPNYSAYSASKGAVIALTRAMAIDFAPQGIRVNVICPGAVYTPMLEPLMEARGKGDRSAGVAATINKHPLGRLGTPEEIARVALFLACDDSSFMTGTVVTADGGVTAQ
ncbi:MAG: glucose 1-dehydrogenase [Pseudonocardiaceae bacterium]|nr:glucose 1-dehydrogenase [Pseudonocardiaceae bacterium]